MAAILNAVAAGAKPGGAAAEERATRSVFVGNIPYEATEEQLKEIFLQAGTVVSFRLVYDRETGKPKGYGFCEYQDLETAQSAMRNLNNHDFNGRPLRVGVAAGEQSKDENKSLQQAIGGPLIESPYGEPCSPEDAPEAISKAVASLPPEQMFELMKQMKLCIQNNPNEARNMLQQNPQLAYALLQGQIVMKIVDPPVALAMLHRQTEQIPPLLPSSQQPEPTVPQDVDHRVGLGPGGIPPGMSQPRPPPATSGPAQANMAPGPLGGLESRMMAPPGGLVEQDYGRPGPVGGRAGLMEERGEGLLGHSPMDDDRPMDALGGPRGFAGDPRDPRASRDMGGRGPGPINRPDMGGYGGRPGGDMGPRSQGPRARGAGPQGLRPPGPGQGPRPQGPGAQGARPEFRDPRQGDPRTQRGMGPPRQAPPVSAVAGMAGLGGAQDQEKAALIMQVLQLSDEQISLLPPDQRQSILILKEQIARAK